MRSDMSKVLIERPRYKKTGQLQEPFDKQALFQAARDAVANDNVEALDDLDLRIHQSNGASRLYQDPKELNDHVGPLKRFIQSRVGCKWDDVYSEACAQMDRRSVQGNHLFDHFLRMVHTKTRLDENGNIMVIRYYGNYELLERETWSSYDEYYVHPETGILCHYKTKAFTREDKPKTIIVLDDDNYIDKVEGIWYQFKVVRRWNRQIPVRRYFMKDGIQESEITGYRLETYTQTVKHQLSKKLLIQYDLSNDR